MKFPSNMTTAIDQAIGKRRDWEYGDDFAEFKNDTPMDEQRFAVQFSHLHQSCFVDDWSSAHGFLKTELTAEQKAMMEFWSDDRFDKVQTDMLTARIRVILWQRLGVLQDA